MHYKSYQHVEKLGSKEVEGILNGRVYLFYKIDGTNSCVWLKDDGTLGFGSRRRELNMVEDNAGFMTAIMTQPENKKVLADLKEFFHYDEKSMSVVGEKTKTRYAMGDKVLVKVTRASKEEQIIDFEIIKKVEEEKNEEELI